MKLQHTLAAAALAALSVSAFADNQSVDLSSGTGSFIGTGTLLDGGSDVITFFGLAAGTYDFLLSVSSQRIADLTGTLNSQVANVITSGSFRFLNLESTGNTPFVLTLSGTPGVQANYSGELSVTAVPEPGTYALLLAGLAVTGFVARRSRRDA